MKGKAIRAAAVSFVSVALLALAAGLTAPPAHAADPAPVLVFQNVKEGDVLTEAAFAIQLCFESAVNHKDLGQGGDFQFIVTEPDGFHLGSRDVFQPDGLGVAIYPGAPINDPVGQWSVHYRVTSPDAQSALEGDINYTVDPDGQTLPRATPPPCIGSGGTATISPPPTDTPEPGASETVSETPASTAFSSPSATQGPIVVESGGSSNTLTYVLLAVVALGLGGFFIAIGLMLRNRRRQS